jgi:hypothetical protein
MIEFARRKKGEGNGNLMVKNWKPVHTAIVMDRIQGMNNTEIAEKYNYAETTIAVICTSRKAKIIIATVEAEIMAKKTLQMPEQRVQAIALAQQRILDFLQDDKLQTMAPLACAPLNMKAFDTLVSADKHIGAGNTINITNNTQFNVLNSEPKRDALAEGLRRAQMVEEMHAHVTGASVDGSEKIKVLK